MNLFKNDSPIIIIGETEFKKNFDKIEFLPLIKSKTLENDKLINEVGTFESKFNPKLLMLKLSSMYLLRKRTFKIVLSNLILDETKIHVLLF